MGRICSAFGSEFGWCLGWHLGGDLVGVVAFWVVGGCLVVVRIGIWPDRPWVGGYRACLSWILGCGLLVGMGWSWGCGWLQNVFGDGLVVVLGEYSFFFFFFLVCVCWLNTVFYGGMLGE